jgi:hypothetical protein
MGQLHGHFTLHSGKEPPVLIAEEVNFKIFCFFRHSFVYVPEYMCKSPVVCALPRVKGGVSYPYKTASIILNFFLFFVFFYRSRAVG